MALLAALALIFLAAPAFSEVCPDDKAISPCMCDDNDLDYDIVVWCSEGSPLEIKRAFNNLRGKQNMAVELEFLVLGGLPTNFFKDIPVKKLTVTSCELEGLAGVEGQPTLLGLEDSLEEFGVFRSLGKYKKVLTISLGHLRRLERLELGDNNIEEIGNEWFQNGPISLTELVLYNNNIEVIGDRAFQSLPNLRYLMLDGNSFSTFHRSMFPRPANKLYSLDLSNNHITDLPEDMFVDMPTLKQVILQANSLHRLPLSTWKPVWNQLDVLLIEENPLQCDSEMKSILKLGRPEELHGHCKGPIGMEDMELKNLLLD